MDFVGRRWTPWRRLRCRPWRAPRAGEGASADPRHPRGPPEVHVYGFVFLLKGSVGQLMRDGRLSEGMGRWLLDWSWGHKSAISIQKDAAACVSDMESLCRRGNVSVDHIAPDLQMVARMGSAGRHPGNCHRQLALLLGAPMIPPPSTHKIALRNRRGRKGFQCRSDRFTHDQPIQFPHNLFSGIF